MLNYLDCKPVKAGSSLLYMDYRGGELHDQEENNNNNVQFPKRLGSVSYKVSFKSPCYKGILILV